MCVSLTGNESGLVGYWNFEEGSGTTALDLSGNGNHGNINDALWDISDAPLETLSDDEYKSGLGEVAKYAFIGNKKLYKYMQENSYLIKLRKPQALETIIEESIKSKAKIVTADKVLYGFLFTAPNYIQEPKSQTWKKYQNRLYSVLQSIIEDGIQKKEFLRHKFFSE